MFENTTTGESLKKDVMFFRCCCSAYPFPPPFNKPDKYAWRHLISPKQAAEYSSWSMRPVVRWRWFQNILSRIWKRIVAAVRHNSRDQHAVNFQNDNSTFFAVRTFNDLRVRFSVCFRIFISTMQMFNLLRKITFYDDLIILRLQFFSRESTSPRFLYPPSCLRLQFAENQHLAMR